MFYVQMITVIEWCAIGIFLAYSITLLRFIKGLKKEAIIESDLKPFISVLIPAKNEEENIKSCLEALHVQDYPEENVEFLILNDVSTDSTQTIAEFYQNKSSKFKAIFLEESNSLVSGKARVIDEGILLATHDIIVICDADCQPNKEWLKTIAGSFSKNVGVESGFTLMKPSKKSYTNFEAVQAMDWMILQGVASGSVGINKPISCIGSNFAFRKSAYNAVGGYKKLPFSITEDLLLYKSISDQTNWEFKFPFSKDSVNWTSPMPTWSEFYKQRKRWLFGSAGIGGFGAVVLGMNIGVHVFPLSLLLFSDWKLCMGIFGLTLLIDTGFISVLVKKLGLKFKLHHYVFYLLYYLLNVVIFPWVFIFDRKVEWKNRVYSVRGKVE